MGKGLERGNRREERRKPETRIEGQRGEQMQRASREGKAKGKKTKAEAQRSSDRHTERKQRMKKENF